MSLRQIIHDNYKHGRGWGHPAQESSNVGVICLVQYKRGRAGPLLLNTKLLATHDGLGIGRIRMRRGEAGKQIGAEKYSTLFRIACATSPTFSGRKCARGGDEKQKKPKGSERATERTNLDVNYGPAAREEGRTEGEETSSAVVVVAVAIAGEETNFGGDGGGGGKSICLAASHAAAHLASSLRASSPKSDRNCQSFSPLFPSIPIRSQDITSRPAKVQIA